MSWTEFRNSLLAIALDEIWAQWSMLGVTSTAAEKKRRVDLEALLLGTFTFGRTDPRLFDEALSWCCRFGDLVNHKRLEKLLSEQADATTWHVALAWADATAEYGGVDWRLKLRVAKSMTGAEAVFLTDQFKPQTTGSEHDTVFERQGLLRGTFTPRDTAKRPDFSSPGLTQLFARKFVGGGCRAEVLTLLLHGFEATTTELAEMSVYSRRLVQDVLGDLNDAGMLDWDPGRGRTTRPTMRKDVRDGLRAVVSHRDLDWSGVYLRRDCPGFFLGLQALWQAAISIAQSDLEGFKAQSLLSDALRVAVEYHGRTDAVAIYRPRLEGGSYDGLLREGLTYLASLAVE